MSDTITFTIDGVEVQGQPGQTVLEAANDAGISIPHLCAHKDLLPFGSCRVCTVVANGRPQASCTQPISEGMIVENDTEQLLAIRSSIIDMLFVEGNHFCMFCETSGNCELQALAYRFGIAAPKYPYLFPKKDVDASHPSMYVDRNRCVLCARCVRSSQELDSKHVFDFVGRGIEKSIAVDAPALTETDATAGDKAPDYCPVGALVRKGGAYHTPIGQRKYDKTPI